MSDAREAMRLALDRGLSEGASLDALHAVLVAAKAQGVSQDVMKQVLDTLRSDVDEVHDDRVLDLLDFVVGWCSPTRRLWP